MGRSPRRHGPMELWAKCGLSEPWKGGKCPFPTPGDLQLQLNVEAWRFASALG